MVYYWIFVDGKKFAFTYDKQQAENIAKANNGYIITVTK